MNGMQPHRWRGLCVCWVLGTLLWSTGQVPLQAQLAITEAMSWASITRNGTNAPGNSDFWELTNYGTNAVDLSGYQFRDNGCGPDGAWQLPALTIAPGESIIFVRYKETTSAAAFKAWWGESNLPTNLQIEFYRPPYAFGFDELGDAARLWDANTNLVDEVSFSEATRGVTFTSDACGRFGALSTNGVCGAFRAPEYGDIGSPGFAPCGPVPLAITRQPASANVDPGMTATLNLEACGLPRPSYQWYFNGAPIQSTAAPAADTPPSVVNYAGCGLAWTASAKPGDLSLPHVQPTDAGEYFAVLTNGLQCLTSRVVTVTVNTNLTAPWIIEPPAKLRFPSLDGLPQTNFVAFEEGCRSDGIPFIAQTARFAVLAGGYPTPTFQWSWSKDGTPFQNLEGETNATLLIYNVVPEQSGTYRVTVSNSVGTTNAYASLTVMPPPRLKITEVMALSVAPGYPNWWELTSFDDQPVNLCGYRWDDRPGDIGGGPTITNNVIIHPGESIIFVEGWTAEAFVRWWGATNLPSNLQIITYSANGFAEWGDEVNLWDYAAVHGAADTERAIDDVSFSTAIPGRSFWFVANDPCSEAGAVSFEGECGVFRAAATGDVASPGWTSYSLPQLVAVSREGAVATLQWKAQPGSINRVEYARTLVSDAAGAWTPLGTFTAISGINVVADATIGTEPCRFYRVVMLSPDDCPCRLAAEAAATP